MSEARLRQKLVQAGYREVDVAEFDRATLLEYYAKVLLTETAYVSAKEQEEGEEAAGDGVENAEFAESDAGVQHTAGGDQSAEEKQLALEERKLEEQRLQREQQREEQRMQRELEEKRLEVQRMQLEQQHEEQRRQRVSGDEMERRQSL